MVIDDCVSIQRFLTVALHQWFAAAISAVQVGQVDGDQWYLPSIDQ